MEGKEQAAVLQNIDTLFSVGVPGAWTDRQLLERFLSSGVESAATAFKTLWSSAMVRWSGESAAVY